MTATYLPASATSATEPSAYGFVRLATQRVIAILSVFKSRRDMNVLAGMDDRMLSDIGLTRGDVRDAVCEPLWRDPTAILVMRVQEKRRGRSVGFGYQRVVEAPSLAPDNFGETVNWPLLAPRC